MKIANSRYCDIFSRQSIESTEDNSSPDEERVKFLAAIPQYSCEVLQLIPKKPAISTDHTAIYQPCTNTIVQLKQSSFSAFRDMSEIKNPKQETPSECTNDDNDHESDNSASALPSHSEDDKQ